MKSLAAGLLSALIAAAPGCAAPPAGASPAPASSAPSAPMARVATVLLSQDFINALLHKELKSPYIEELTIHLLPKEGEIDARGTLKMPVEEMLAMNLDPRLGAFKFQIAIQPKTTRRGHLILILPIGRTYLWPAQSENPEEDRIIVPVQLLSLALASARGYLSAVSGDFTSFDRRIKRLEGKLEDVDRRLAKATDPEDKAELKDERHGLRLQIEAAPIERRQLQALGKEVKELLAFSGEGEVKLDQELASKRNALILRLKLGQFVPYLKDIELEGIRFIHDDKGGADENFFAVDIAAPLGRALPPRAPVSGARRPGGAVPDVVVKLDEALLESEDVVADEQTGPNSKLKDFTLDLQGDGLHTHGVWKGPLGIKFPFDADLEFVWTAPDQFELRVKDIKVEHLDLTALRSVVLEAAQKRLEGAMKGVCRFDYVDDKKIKDKALRATFRPGALLPALPNLVLTDVETRDGVLLLKAGRR